MQRNVLTLSLLGLLAPSLCAQQAPPTATETPSPTATETPSATANPKEAAVRARSEAIATAFDAGKPEAIAAVFLPEGELVDEDGNVYRGREEIAGLFGSFFEIFPGATTQLDIEMVRFVGPDLAIEDGTRTVTTKDGEAEARSRYILIWKQSGDTWQVASARQYEEGLEPTPHEMLQPLAWMIGEWVDESHESLVDMSCQWSEDGNYLLRKFVVTMAGETVLDTVQRLGWDPLSKKIKSWSFDSDGGTGEGYWTEIEGRWIVKTTAVLPNGQLASATVVYQPIDDDQFLMRGLDRIVGDGYAPDFEATIVRKPPQPAAAQPAR